ncbi:MAG: metallophosphoesterase [Rhodospirillales bacterium]|nr:metallophosphoesterase [Rhodospirillales bacterium]
MRLPLRIVGDVHGDAHAFAHAVATDRFVIQLGDLVDHGPDSAGALTIALELLATGRGLFLLGNHDLKLARALRGEAVRRDPALETTLAQVGPALAAAALPAILAAPAWLRLGRYVFVHAGFHSAMLDTAPPAISAGRVTGPLSRALYGQPTGRTQPDGYPERSLDWIRWIPAGFTVYCGHDRRSSDGRPWVRRNDAGGTAVFLDTGAGKGGHLSWIDLPPAAATAPGHGRSEGSDTGINRSPQLT